MGFSVMLSDQELLFQRSQVLLPAPTWQLTAHFNSKRSDALSQPPWAPHASDDQAYSLAKHPCTVSKNKIVFTRKGKGEGCTVNDSTGSDITDWES